MYIYLYIHIYTQKSVENKSCQVFATNYCQQKGYKFDTEVVMTD